MERLGGAPVVHVGHLMYARDSAVRRTALFGEKFAPNVVDGVLLQRNPGIAALLRAVVNQSVLANVQVASARTAPPLVRFAVGDIVLEPVEASVMVLLELLHLQEDFALLRT